MDKLKVFISINTRFMTKLEQNTVFVYTDDKEELI